MTTLASREAARLAIKAPVAAKSIDQAFAAAGTAIPSGILLGSIMTARKMTAAAPDRTRRTPKTENLADRISAALR